MVNIDVEIIDPHHPNRNKNEIYSFSRVPNVEETVLIRRLDKNNELKNEVFRVVAVTHFTGLSDLTLGRDPVAIIYVR